jgi:threonine dehydrogenase-like Zn-dependent dehydrogenase
MQRGIRLVGNGQAPVHKYWEDLLAMIVSGELDPLVMVSHRVKLEDLKIVYDKFKNHEDGMQKVFVETIHSLPKANGSPELTSYS